MRSDKELQDITFNILRKKIYTSENCKKGMIRMVFLSVNFIPNNEKKKFLEDVKSGKIRVLFEEIEKADVVDENFPIFLSYQTLSNDEWKKILNMKKEIMESINKAA